MPVVLPALGAFFSTYGPAIAAGVASSAAGAGISAALAPGSKVNVPPPPGAAMISPQGQQAAADQRRRAAAAGGLQSTQTGAGASFGGPTGGGKSLLGQ